jgi:SAM-dependent methyltransferase
LIAGRFPHDLPDVGPFDVITMLAVLEHVPPQELPELVGSCGQRIKPGGLLIITAPAPVVDHILSVLRFARVIDGMSVEEHHGLDPRKTPEIFVGKWFSLCRAERFQLGLNHLFILQRRTHE